MSLLIVVLITLCIGSQGIKESFSKKNPPIQNMDKHLKEILK